jgi:flavin reductase (DIM6/NTAB) family NADH-FMN oxidoreductase RutF
MKKEIELKRAKWLVEPGCVVLVTSGDMENPNVMTFSWQTPVNNADPCRILLVINKIRYSYELIKQNSELVINVPGSDLLEQTHYVGIVSGRDENKFEKSGLTPVPAKTVQPPLIEQCAGHLECKVTQIFEMQSHDLLICDVQRALAEEKYFDRQWIPEKFHTLHYLRGNKYALLQKTVQAKTT